MTVAKHSHIPAGTLFCAGCGDDVSTAFVIDHIIPQTRNGSDDENNIQILCLECNSSKNNRTMVEWIADKSARCHPHWTGRERSAPLGSENEKKFPTDDVPIGQPTYYLIKRRHKQRPLYTEPPQVAYGHKAYRRLKKRGVLIESERPLPTRAERRQTARNDWSSAKFRDRL